jgi:hypothetical protein
MGVFGVPPIVLAANVESAVTFTLIIPITLGVIGMCVAALRTALKGGAN